MIYCVDKVYIYSELKPFDKACVSVCSKEAYNVEHLYHPHGITFYRTSARDKPFLRSELLSSSVSVYMISIVDGTIALILSVVIVGIAKKLECYYKRLRACCCHTTQRANYMLAFLNCTIIVKRDECTNCVAY